MYLGRLFIKYTVCMCVRTRNNVGDMWAVVLRAVHKTPGSTDSYRLDYRSIGGRTWRLRLEGAGSGEQGGTSRLVFVVFGCRKHRFTLSSGCVLLSCLVYGF